MSLIEAVLLGIIQGLTEFLPVSSSGHLELVKSLLGIETTGGVTFTVVVHGATVLSTIVVFHRDIFDLIKGVLQFRWNDTADYVVKILISAIPVVTIGLLFREEIESLFSNNVLLVGCMLLVTGGLLAFTYCAPHEGKEVGKSKAFLIGIAQAFAVLPGISRSGSTIAVALLLGVDKKKATRFSFLMALIPIVGANAKDILDGGLASSSVSTISLLFGFFAAFISGVLACRWMIAIVNHGKLIHFAYYCGIVGLGSIAAHFIFL
tara:strand:+ start:1373 stop:2164 length:792 start_codon:yes stop_codon:yes gene_type:complete